ncbi:hypothetical protein GH714_008438 [Hevea brasiliensis]|uniref:RING-type E3 ubiquitin transferase n=1 Tax=Hevea brasiliensis TaxID=3981 RepID=A0A6A6N9X5_HEVBR|nr:hypothetical protein GH714_008438 [Hevea brasiliensis]
MNATYQDVGASDHQSDFPSESEASNHPCGYPQPGFHLSCSENNETALELPNSWKLFVQEIDNKSQVIYAKDSGGCLPRRLILNLNLSVSPFEIMNRKENITLFKCPSRKMKDSFNNIWQIPCLSDLHYDVLAILSDWSIVDPDIVYAPRYMTIQKLRPLMCGVPGVHSSIELASNSIDFAYKSVRGFNKDYSNRCNPRYSPPCSNSHSTLP